MSSRQGRPYPIVLTQLHALRCLVVGGGAVAARKVRALLEAGARVRVISPELHPDLAAWRDAGALVHVPQAYRSGDLADEQLVFAATNHQAVNAAVGEEAQQRGILFNLADDPDGSSFHSMGTVARGDVLLAVSTGGDSPALAALLRRKLEDSVGPEYGVLAARLGELRRGDATALPPELRTQLWRALASEQALDFIRADDLAGLERYIGDMLADLKQRNLAPSARS